MSDDNIIKFPDRGAQVQGAAQTPEGLQQQGEPASLETYEQLEQMGRRVTTITEAQAKALQMILGDQAFVCISMSPDADGTGADIRTSVGGDRETIQAVANGAGQGLHGVLSRLLDREDLL